MRKVRFYQADVFSNSPFGGNPVVVVPDPGPMSTVEMLTLTRGLNFAETTFVVTPSLPGAAFAVRCFTPTTEVPYSAHQLLGAAYVLAASGRLVQDVSSPHIDVQVGDDGHREVVLTRRGGRIERVALVEPVPSLRREEDGYHAVAAALSIDVVAILETGLPMEVIASGLDCLVVPIQYLWAVQDVLPVEQLIDGALTTSGADCLVVFSTQTLSPACQAHVRVFAPGLGVREDPATGTAASAVADYMVRHGLVQAAPELHLAIEQGSEMGRPSLIEVDFDLSAMPPRLYVGGQVARSVEGHVYF